MMLNQMSKLSKNDSSTVSGAMSGETSISPVVASSISVASPSSTRLSADRASVTGVDIALAEIRHPVREIALRSGLLEAIGEDRIFHTIQEAVEALQSR